MRSLRFLLAVIAMLAVAPAVMLAKNTTEEVCPRPAAGSVIPEPADLRSQSGTLKVELTYRSSRDAHGLIRYCYQSGDGSIAPNLRVHPGDWLIVSLKNDLKASPSAPQDKAMGMPMPKQMHMPVPNPCADGQMDALSTNLHFHGLSVPPVCHQDDVLKTMIAPGAPPLNIASRFRRTAAGLVLVSPARPWVQQRAGARRGLGGADRGGHRASQSSACRPAGASACRAGPGLDQPGCNAIKNVCCAAGACPARCRGRCPQHRHRRRETVARTFRSISCRCRIRIIRPP